MHFKNQKLINQRFQFLKPKMFKKALLHQINKLINLMHLKIYPIKVYKRPKKLKIILGKIETELQDLQLKWISVLNMLKSQK